MQIDDGISMARGRGPGSNHFFNEARRASPIGLESEMALRFEISINRENQRAVVRCGRGHGLEKSSREKIMPLVVEEDPVKPTEGGVQMLIAPSVTTAMEVEVFQFEFIDELAEGGHQTSVDIGIIFISCIGNQVEVASQDQR